MKRLVINVSPAAEEAFPLVCRELNLTSDVLTAENAAAVFELLVLERAYQGEITPVAPHVQNLDAMLRSILDPNVAFDVTIVPNWNNTDRKPSLLEIFAAVAEASPEDPWVQQVLAKEEHQDTWKIALATVYSLPGGAWREPETWRLIERTYELMRKHEQKLLDTTPSSGQNGTASSAKPST